MGNVLSLAETAYLKSRVGDLAEKLIFIGGKPIELERDWQYDLVSSSEEYEAWNKCRQSGFSWGMALRCLVRTHVFPDNSYNAILVSINREEAREKIRYIELFYDGFKGRKKTVIANQLQYEFTNGNSILSYPSRPVRGKPNVDLLLDEFAHIREARDIYKGSTASTVRQSYGVTIGSTPFGRGPFYDVVKGAGQPGEFKRFKLREVPWWISHILCNNVHDARIFAPGMTLQQRVDAFGTPNLINEFEIQSQETFMTEFETYFSDYGNSALTEEQIMACHDGDQSCRVLDFDLDNKSIQPMEILRTVLAELAFEESFHTCFIGYDVGRQKNAAELILTDWFGGKLKTRLYLTLRKCPYPLQSEILTYILKNLPIRKCVIDSQGLGNQIAEELQLAFSTKVMPIPTSDKAKSEMVALLVKVFEEKLIALYPTRRICTQLLEVKKEYTTEGRILYRSVSSKDTGGEVGASYKAHADLFWALAMNCLAAKDFLMDSAVKITSRSPALVIPKSGWSGHARSTGNGLLAKFGRR